MIAYSAILGAVLALMGFWLPIRETVRERRLAASEIAMWQGKDVRSVLLVLLPISAVVSTILFIVLGETWTLANVITVYGGLFGVASIIYTVSKM